MQQINTPDQHLDADSVEFKYIEHIMLNDRFEDEYNDKAISELLKPINEEITEATILKFKITKLNEYNNFLKVYSKSQKNIFKHQQINTVFKIVTQYLDRYNPLLNLLATPLQQQLPEIFEERRAIPNSLLRGALFGIVKKGKRAIVENQKIFTMSQYDLAFSGAELDQNDLEVWDTLIYLAKKKQIDSELVITLYELRKQMGYAQTRSAYQKIIERAKRLKFATVEIKHENYTYMGNLIDEVLIDEKSDGKLVIKFNKKLSSLFSDKDYTIISMDIRKQIGENQLARWLYNFYESHKHPIPFTIEYLKELCRSEANIYKFKSMLKEALELVKRGYLYVGKEFEYQIVDNKVIINKVRQEVQKQLF